MVISHLKKNKPTPALGHRYIPSAQQLATNKPELQHRAIRTNLKLSDNRNGASELLVNHKSKDSHHGSTAVVQLDGTLGKLGLLIEGIPAEVKSSITEITNELSLSGDILHDGKLEEANEGQDLESSSNRNLEGASPSLSNVGELGSIV
ncbi:hypothetical protein ACHAXN_000317 [Cyclotella atomus]